MTQTSAALVPVTAPATSKSAPAATPDEFMARLVARRAATLAATPKKIPGVTITGAAAIGHIELREPIAPGPKQHLILVPSQPAAKSVIKTVLPARWQPGYQAEAPKPGPGSGLSRFVDPQKVAERKRVKEEERRRAEQQRRIAEAANLAARAQEKAKKAAEAEAREAKNKARQRGGKKGGAQKRGKK